MYTSYYQLAKKPFQISSDPAFLWLGEKHLEALATLKYGILDNRGFLLLTGDVGTGKTTVVNALLGSLDEEVVRAFVPDPNLERMEFYNYIAQGFGLEEAFVSKGVFLKQFGAFLNRVHDEGKKALLIIDEAQLLTQELLEEIRLLSNIERAETKLLTIFFVGQNEFNDILSQHQNRAVRQRITINYNIQTLTLAETTEYVRHRLKVAGTTEPLFDNLAMEEIYRSSQGYPRRINVICDHALLTGFVKETKNITASMIRDCAREVTVPGKRTRNDFDFIAPDVPAPEPLNPSSLSTPGTEIMPGRPDEEKKEQRSGAPQQQRVAKEQGKTQQADAPEKTSRASRSGGRTVAAGILVTVLLVLYGMFPDTFESLFDPAAEKNHQVVTTVNDGPPSMEKDPRTVEVKEGGDEVPAKPQDRSENESSSQPEPPRDSHLQKKESVDAGSGPVSTVTGQEHRFEVPAPPDQPEVERVDPASDAKEDTQVEAVRPALPEEKLIVRFDSSTTGIDAKGKSDLDRFCAIMLHYPEYVIRVKGYTDSSGYMEQNQRLSETRASVVRYYLIKKGIARDSVTSEGLGSADPIRSNETLPGRIINRRVEITIEPKNL